MLSWSLLLLLLSLFGAEGKWGARVRCGIVSLCELFLKQTATASSCWAKGRGKGHAGRGEGMLLRETSDLQPGILVFHLLGLLGPRLWSFDSQDIAVLVIFLKCLMTIEITSSPRFLENSTRLFGEVVWQSKNYGDTLSKPLLRLAWETGKHGS